MKFNKRSGLWYTQEDSQYAMKEYDKLWPNITSDDIVLDIGGHIGAFSRQCNRIGAKSYVYEADPFNFECLVKNVDSSLTAAFNLAVVGGSESGTMSFFRHAWSSTGSLVKRDDATQEIEVNTVPIVDLLNRHQPTVLKVDIEGGEHAFDWDTIVRHPTLRLLAIEYHYWSDTFDSSGCGHIRSVIDQYTKPIKSPKITKKGATTGIYRFNRD